VENPGVLLNKAVFFSKSDFFLLGQDDGRRNSPVPFLTFLKYYTWWDFKETILKKLWHLGTVWNNGILLSVNPL
jgi:hypothetical protein